MTTQKTDLVPPLTPGMQVVLLPELVVQYLLNAKMHIVAKEQRGMVFEGEETVLHTRDYDVVLKVAARMRPSLPEKLTAGAILSAYKKAQSMVREEVFYPGVVNVMYYPVLTPGSAFYRCMLPALALNRGTSVRAHLSMRMIPGEAMAYDVVVFQIDHSPHTLAFAKNLQSMGKKVVFEIDDAFDCLSPSQPQHAGYATPERQAEVRAMMRQADAVTVTTEPLRRMYERDCKRISIVPNMIDLANWPRSTPHRTGAFRVLWAGSPSHADDLALVAPVLTEFARRAKAIRLVFFGAVPDGLVVPKDQVEILPFAPFEEYPNRLADVQADVALAPLAPTTFNRCKSGVKAMEYMATGYPVIASAIEPYQFVRHAVDGFLFQSPKELGDILISTFDNRPGLLKVRDAAFDRVREFDISTRRAEVERFFTSLMEA
jgi:glycosyltransferase involved in cell wall biosynthesis